MINKKNILIEIGAIKPGGGPSGYTYNLFEGYKKIKYIFPHLNIYSFAQRDTKRTKSMIGKVDFDLKVFLSKYLPNWVRTIKFRFSRKRKLMLAAQIVVFQGIQKPTAIKSIKNKVFSVYMPHTPTIAADEILMNSKLYNTSLSKREYRNMVKQERELINAADCVVFASIGASEEYWKAFNKELTNKKIEYIASGIDLPNIDTNSTPNVDILNGVFFIGRYVEHKGYDLYCATANLVKTINPNIKFYSIGGGPIKSNDNVIDLGWQENPYPFIQAASFIVIPNTYSYYDLLPLECAALGKPLVMTKVGGNVDQLNELPDSIGATIQVDNLAESIIEAFNRKLNEPSWGENNRIKYSNFFNSEAFATRWCNFLDRIDITD